jgi:hypothetical protein
MDTGGLRELGSQKHLDGFVAELPIRFDKREQQSARRLWVVRPFVLQALKTLLEAQTALVGTVSRLAEVE